MEVRDHQKRIASKDVVFSPRLEGQQVANDGYPDEEPDDDFQGNGIGSEDEDDEGEFTGLGTNQHSSTEDNRYRTSNSRAKKARDDNPGTRKNKTLS